MAFTTLVDTDTLARHIADPMYAIVDCRFTLEDDAWGEREYAVGHIPGAVYAHLNRDLSGPKTGSNGRHPLPDQEALGQTFSRLGIDSTMQVVAYDQDTGMFASRLWWLLRWLGHDDVAVLDGGFAKWIAERRPTSMDRRSPTPRSFRGQARPDATIDASRVAAIAHQPGWRLVDARAPERYRGETEPIDRVPGHIPGAVNHFFKQNLGDRGTFLPPADLRANLLNAIGGTLPDHVVCYCGSGVTACHNLLALEHAGLHGAKLYPGSWSEWSSDPARPVETDQHK